MAADGSFLYARGYDGWLSIVDTACRSMRTVPGHASSQDVLSPDGKLLYAAHNTTDSWISVTDADGVLVGAVTVDDEITGLAISPDGSRLYVAASERNTYYQYPRGALHEVDTRTGAVSHSMDVGVCPGAVTISADGRSAYVIHYDIGSISALDLATGHVTPIRLGDAPLTVAISPDGRRAYVINERSVSAIDTATHEVQNFAVGDSPRGLAISPDGGRIFVTDPAGQSVSVIGTSCRSVVATVAVGGHPEAVAISPRDLDLYVGDYWSASVTVLSASDADVDFEASSAAPLLEIAS
ncbi:MAG TPA: hypothetical protein VMU34_05435, partial [Mycobacterium sp.]|nr:hypothetical protein [Mycobacterium sp.]